eukprot:30827-Pelagococcus_subviridis.AAC.4
MARWIWKEGGQKTRDRRSDRDFPCCRQRQTRRFKRDDDEDDEGWTDADAHLGRIRASRRT